MVTMSAIGRPVSKLSGYAPAIPTPFDDAGTVDGAALEQFRDRQIKQRATALAVCGTIGKASMRPPPALAYSYANTSRL